jgi:carbamoyl-phosphate synthase large subunit
MNKDAYRLIGTSIYDDSVAPAFCDIFELAPKTSEPDYVDWLREIINKHNVDMIIPGIEADMLAWNEAREVLSETGAAVLLNNPELIELCSDKWKFYDHLQGSVSNNLIESRLEGSFEELRDAFGLPFLLKPRRGFASKGIVIVETRDIFEAHEHELGSVLMAQPIVGTIDQEYTVSAFFDKDSNLLCHMGLRRKLAKEGFTEKAEVFDPEGAEEVMRALAAQLKPVGPTNYQFRVDSGELKLLEINPRISSATSIRTAFGYNESVMSVDYFLDGVVPTHPVIKNGYAVRYVEDYIVYDRDTV